MRIAFVSEPESPNAWYRSIGPMVALMRCHGHEIRQVVKPGDRWLVELVNGCDVLHVHRKHDERALKLIRHAKESGMAVVWDNDDDFSAVPKGTAAYKRFGGVAGERVQVALRRIVGLADVVTTPSARIAALYRELGAPDVRVIENYVRDEALQVPPRANGAGLTIGWLAGIEHHLDVERLPIGDAVARLLAAHPDVRVVTIGAGLGVRHERYEHVRQVDFFDLLGHMASWDVGIAPLADIPLNRARSNVKVKEYAALGMPWLASPVGPYAGLGEKQGGLLVPDDGWHEALERIVVKDRERRKLAKRARRWGGDQAIAANVHHWEAVLSDALNRR
jgi:glycosyltransferase involved in cell wall biosynthesis